MFQNAFLDIAIGLMLMYLVLSLLCTVINEWIATRLNLRAVGLQAALKALLDDESLRTAFFEHGLIAGTRATVTVGNKTLMATLQTPASTPATPPPPASAVRVEPSYLS